MELRQYQKAAVERGLLANLLLGDECGLGKTAMAISAGKSWREGMSVPDAFRALIVHPHRLQATWIDELAKWDPTAPVHVAGEKPLSARECHGWYLVSYDQLIRKPKAWLQYIMWDMLIADECHRIKNRSTLRAIALKRIGATRKIGLSATPMEKKDPSDLWSILNWLFPNAYTSFWKFQETYCQTQINWAGYRQVIGPRNVEQLGHELRKVMLRRTKQEVAPELPPRIIQEVHVPMGVSQEKAYKKIKSSRDIDVDMEDRNIHLLIPNALAKVVRLQQVSTFPNVLALSCESAKMAWIREFIEDHEDEPMIVFSKFRAPILHLMDEYPGSAVIVGGTTQHVQAFLDGRVNKLFGTIASMGEGLSLQRARYAVFLDQDWSSIKMTQAIDRIHRINIDEPKVIYHLWSTPTDRLVLKALNEKWDEAQLVYEFLRTYKEGEG